ncbi:unnamed protein product [Staurois parvus]|uniref:Uncharacterized protein n=1 Tax=Staurois parvus TaxID=386267 RepID=A0ABN9EDP0_9NEOB|nr:unnamed protein product [Staurois parvus]
MLHIRGALLQKLQGYSQVLRSDRYVSARGRLTIWKLRHCLRAQGQ